MPREVQPCGTVAAYKRHRRAKEDACPACVAAKRRHEAERRAAQRVPEVPIKLPDGPSSDPSEIATEAELRWHVRMLKSAIEWSAENDPSKMSALVRERRETLTALNDLAGDVEDEGGALSGFLGGPLGLVGGAAATA